MQSTTYRLIVTFELAGYGDEARHDEKAIEQTQNLCDSESLALVSLERRIASWKRIK